MKNQRTKKPSQKIQQELAKKEQETRQQIFKNASKTYYNSSLFFSAQEREDVTKFYAFVRVADDFVDNIPQDPKGFIRYKQDFYDTYAGKKKQATHLANKGMIYLMRKYDLPISWIDAFLAAMQSDLTVSVSKNNTMTKKKQQQRCQTLEHTKTYMFGSAEVIGLVMAKILHLPKVSYKYAARLGRAFQYVNFLRDIQEDIELDRRYIPKNLVTNAGLKDITFEEANKHRAAFIRLMRQELDRYLVWQTQAEKGFKYIPWRARVAVKTASDMYAWSAQKIYDNPFLIFEKKVKPKKARVLLQVLLNVLQSSYTRY